MDPLKQAEKERLERNNSCRIAFHEEMALWTEEYTQAKDEQRRLGWTKPKLGRLGKLTPKPGVDGPDGDNSEGEGEDDENNGENDD